MGKLLVAAAAVLAALSIAGVASAGPVKFGAADDTGKYADDCGLSFFGQMNDIGFTVDRMAILWDESRPNDIVEQGFLDRSIPCAQQLGITVVFDVFPLRPAAISADPVNRSAQFVSWLQNVAQRYPSVTSIIVGNEPNVNRFWQPVATSPTQFEALLALSYDGLKAVNPNIDVIGVGLSPRGNDDPNAASNPSFSPVNWIAQFAKAYRDSGRTKPLMDEFSFHPYANHNNDPFSKGYEWPNAGGSNFDRIKQAFWDGFHGTGQKIFAEQPGGRVTQGAAADDACNSPVSSIVLCMNLDEAGTQTGPNGHTGYTGAESPNLVPELVDEGTQARYYTELMDMAACDPSVESMLFFDFVDETPLDRFQSGEIYADGARKQSYPAIQAKIKSDGGRCTGQPSTWRHADGVIGASTIARTPDVVPVSNRYWAFSATADEDAGYTAWIANAAGKKVATVSGTIQAYFTPLVKFPGNALARGCYSVGITMSATMNAERQTTIKVDKFKVGAATKCSAAGAGKPAVKPKAKPKKKPKQKPKR